MTWSDLRDELAPEAISSAPPVVVSRAGAIVVLLSLFAAIVFSIATLRVDPAVVKRVELLNSYGAVRSPCVPPRGDRARADSGLAAPA